MTFQMTSFRASRSCAPDHWHLPVCFPPPYSIQQIIAQECARHDVRRFVDATKLLGVATNNPLTSCPGYCRRKLVYAMETSGRVRCIRLWYNQSGAGHSICPLRSRSKLSTEAHRVFGNLAAIRVRLGCRDLAYSCPHCKTIVTGYPRTSKCRVHAFWSH